MSPESVDAPVVEPELNFCVVLRNFQLLLLVPRNGLEALRFRRRLQLPESTAMVQMPPSQHNAMVSEAFAEHYESIFLQDNAPEVHLRAETVPRLVQLLQPGDLRMLTATDCTFDMHPSRTRIMWQQLRGSDSMFLVEASQSRLQQGEPGRVLRIPPGVNSAASTSPHDEDPDGSQLF